MLTDDQKKRIEDVALGQVINRRKSLESQIAALRKQIVVISSVAKVDLIDEMQELEDIVAEGKTKSEIAIEEEGAKMK